MTTPLGHRRHTTFAPSPRRGLRLSIRRLSLLAPTLGLMAALLVAGPALSALRLGTNNAETLTGTNGADQITGKGGEDVLKGLAGNDTYFFADGFSARADNSVGFDTLVEPASFVVAGKRVSGGSDTVSFRGVKTGSVTIRLEREWATSSGHKATGPGGEVRFSYQNVGVLTQSFVEQGIGGQGSGDWVSGGGAANVLEPGGGATDTLRDFGGYNDGPAGLPELAVSNDVFKGFGDNTGTD